MPLIVHLIDFSTRNPWIEGQMDVFRKHGIEQGLLTISAPGEIHDAAIRNGFQKVQYVNHSVSGFFHASSLLKHWSKGEKVYIYAHGHRPAIYASFIRTLTGIDFILCHHHSPASFVVLRKRMFIRASIHMALARFYLIRAYRVQSFSPEATNNLIHKRIDSKKIVEIPLGMNFDKYFKIVGEPTRKQTSKIIEIVSVSRLVWEKRIDLGIRSVAHLVKSGILVNYTIVGEGPELSNLTKLVKDLDIVGHIAFLGRREDINQILNASDVFFHLSLTESYGQVLMEARLADIPIFSSACGVALEMEEKKDPLVHIFRSSEPKTIAGELSAFFKKCELLSNIYTPNPRELYKGHEYKKVLLNVERMFHEIFESER